MHELWTGPGPDGSASWSLNCNLTSKVPGLSNSCVLDLPSEGNARARLFEQKRLTQILAAEAIAWDPDWGTIKSIESLSNTVDWPEWLPYCGHVIYVKQRKARLPRLPESVRVEDLAERGTIIEALPESFDLQNPDHCRLVRALVETLHRGKVIS